ncbi:calcium-binding protein [Micromonospora sp. NPDC051925]|uniref:calcium-binding protein n=1 Tax=Micromonospora sp. NPDC051925 TaxID=3364288 RepID=UPI0037CC104F
MSERLRKATIGVCGSLVTAAVPLLFAAAPAYASGGSAYVIDSTLYYVALPGQVNNVTIKQGTDGRYHVTDWASPVTPSSTCLTVTDHEVSCDSFALTSVWADTGDMADTLGVRGTLIATVYGGSGDDMLMAGDLGSMLDGGAGDDRLLGGPGDDELYGGPGDDEITGSDGDDTLVGGTGDDLLSGEAGPDVLHGDDLPPIRQLVRVANPVPLDRDICAVGVDGDQAFSCEVLR